MEIAEKLHASADFTPGGSASGIHLLGGLVDPRHSNEET